MGGGIMRNQRRGSAGQWTLASIAILATAALVVWIIANRPPPPHFDELRIEASPERQAVRSGPRLQIDAQGAKRVRRLESGVVEFREADEQFGRGEYTASIFLPVELDQPLEASIVVGFIGCDITVRVGETVLAEATQSDQSPLTTERLAFLPGVTDLRIDIVPQTEDAQCTVAWIKDNARGPEPLPAFVKETAPAEPEGSEP